MGIMVNEDPTAFEAGFDDNVCTTCYGRGLIIDDTDRVGRCPTCDGSGSA